MSLTTSPFVDASVVTRAPEVILYGGGNTGRDVCRVLLNAGVHVSCVIDRRAVEGSELLGVPVRTLENCPLAAAARSDVPVILSLFNRAVDVYELAESLREEGFTQLVSFVDLHALFAEELGDRFWLTRRGYLEESRDEIHAARSLWADELSRQIYDGFLCLRAHGAYTAAMRPDPASLQYFPRDLPRWLDGGPLRVVDCGAYTGDLMHLISKSGRRVEASAHFEPDPHNFKQLTEFLRARKSEAGWPAMLWPCAVTDRPGSVRFEAGLDEASRIGSSGRSLVPAVRLDDVLIDWRPTFVKMDIEGSEVDALNGAVNVISRSRPSLAICVYHRPDHLWRIPLMLSIWSGLDGYRFYLRRHGYDGFDTVLYGMPPS